MSQARAQFHWDDPLLLNSQLSDDERMVRDAAAAYCQDKLAPRILEAFRHERMDTSIFREMGELGLLGPTIPEQYGGPGLNYGTVVAIPQGSVGAHLDGCRPSEDNGRTSSQWCHVTWSGYSGWVSSCCILPDPDAVPPVVPAQAAPDTGFSCLDGALRALPGACGVSSEGGAAHRECTEESNDVGIAASVAMSMQACLQNCVAGGYLAQVNWPDVEKALDYTT